jgi:Zn-dependent protease with chaperone function
MGMGDGMGRNFWVMEFVGGVIGIVVWLLVAIAAFNEVMGDSSTPVRFTVVDWVLMGGIGVAVMLHMDWWRTR